ncbi:MAG TPA: acyl carrier protein [Pirellulales bacterium]|jgi:acyl carrier protein|nr:acyl carrier protein [Pirellulales bacterium]
MPSTVEERARKVVAEVFGLPLATVTSQTSHENVDDWDSLNVLNVLMAIEGEFDVSVSPEDAAEFVSVERIVAVLRTKGVS